MLILRPLPEDSVVDIFLLYFLPVPLAWASRPVKPRRLTVVDGKAGAKDSRRPLPARKVRASTAPRERRRSGGRLKAPAAGR